MDRWVDNDVWQSKPFQNRAPHQAIYECRRRSFWQRNRNRIVLAGPSFVAGVIVGYRLIQGCAL